jgi:hypothetical protein
MRPESTFRSRVADIPITSDPAVIRRLDLGMATELRDYRITDGSLDQFVEEWRTHIAPLRRELGFTIERAWTVDADSRFVWLLSHPGGWEAFEAADRAYYASPQRTSLDPNPARLIEDQVISKLVEVELP